MQTIFSNHNFIFEAVYFLKRNNIDACALREERVKSKGMSLV